MPTPTELARLRTQLDDEQLAHLQRLLASWSLLADLSFSDLLLVAPVATPPPGTGPQLVVLGQIRPNNRSTLVSQDLVGQTVPEQRWELAAEALHTGRIVEGTIFDVDLEEEVPISNVPVRYKDKFIAVLLRIQGPLRGPATLYERIYLGVFERFCQMATEASFPYDGEPSAEETPRVGDGAMLVDAQGRVEFTTPNAVNALHRMGVYSPPEGSKLDGLGVDSTFVATALETRRPVVEEIERRPDVAVLAHCLPLLAEGEVTGALILLRDITDVRRLSRLVLSKEAAIREVHHRVKNNLQTISALLRLQARRTDEGAGRSALLEAERRIRSIAVVHEILSREPGDQVPFDDIVGPIVAMAEDSVVVSRPIEIMVEGDLGEMTADMATPLAVAMAELLQNAVEHAFAVDPDSEDPGGRGARRWRRAPGGLRPRDHDEPGSQHRAGPGPHAAPGHDRAGQGGEGAGRRLTSDDRRAAAGSASADRTAVKLPAQCCWLTSERRRAASHCLRSRLRSSSEVAPQTPDSWFVASANSRQASTAPQAPQTRFAASIWSTAGPVEPIGKKRSGSVLRQAAASRHSSALQSTVRFQVRAMASLLLVRSGGVAGGFVRFFTRRAAEGFRPNEGPKRTYRWGPLPARGFREFVAGRSPAL